MSYSNWTIIGGILQGDISYSLKKVLVTSSYADFELTAFGEKWQEFDIAFEYRASKKDEWQDDTSIVQTSAKYLRGNKLYGITASKTGTTTTIRWQYSDNNLFYSNVPQIRLRVLPRVRTLSSSGAYTTISSLYADSLINFDSITTNRCIGLDKSGKYMAITGTSFSILSSPNDASPLYSYSGVVNPNFAIQINSGNYIVSDYGNNRVLELNSTLTSIVRNYSIGGAVFFDYSEQNETLLITNQTTNQIIEVTWSDLDFGTTLWQSTCILNSPQCATYKQGDVNYIVIADTNNNRIIKYDKVNNYYQYLDYYRLSEDDDSITHEISSFYLPFRVYQYSDGHICVVEKEGRPISFFTIESSSSNSSSSSSGDLIWLEDGDELWTEGGIPIILE